MSYDEHLISQAGGDGDVLEQIQRRADGAAHWKVRNVADTDRTYLLALVREQQARMADVWDEGFDRGFYDPLAGGGRDASESLAKNPYRATAGSKP